MNTFFLSTCLLYLPDLRGGLQVNTTAFLHRKNANVRASLSAAIWRSQFDLFPNRVRDFHSLATPEDITARPPIQARNRHAAPSLQQRLDTLPEYTRALNRPKAPRSKLLVYHGRLRTRALPRASAHPLATVIHRISALPPGQLHPVASASPAADTSRLPIRLWKASSSSSDATD